MLCIVKYITWLTIHRNLEHFDFYINPTWQVQIHKSINGFWTWIYNINKTLMGTHFILFLGSLVYKGSTIHTIFILCSRQWYWTNYFCTISFSSINNSFGSNINNLMIVCLYFDT